MVTNIAGRLARLERYYGGTCGTCHGYPVRIACLNEDGTETGSNLPEDGCPTGARPVAGR
jgi:hypothetical protein